jgi:hypothetical protein
MRLRPLSYPDRESVDGEGRLGEGVAVIPGGSDGIAPDAEAAGDSEPLRDVTAAIGYYRCQPNRGIL